MINSKLLDGIIKLRLDGMSLRNIVKELNVPKSTVSKYCQGLRPNNPVNRNQSLASAAFANKKKEAREETIRLAIKEWPKRKRDPQIMGLLGLYWGEGSKRTKKITTEFSICNSDPGVLSATISGLLKLGVNRSDIKLNIRLYSEHDDQVLKEWTKQLNLPVSNVFRIKRRGKFKFTYSHCGIGVIRVTKSSSLWLRIITWLNCWRKELGVTEDWQDSPDHKAIGAAGGS